MNKDIFIGIFIPFFGTALGSGLVLFMKREFNFFIKDFLTALASGIMTAASVWSLIIPAVEDSAHLGRLAFVPVCVGIASGVVFMAVPDALADRYFQLNTKGSFSMILAVTIHNIPEGMAVGSVLASALEHNSKALMASALVLSLGIAVQNIPEGAVISMPLYASGGSKAKALAVGVLSGIVEPFGALTALVAAKAVGVMLPYFLSFAAGAMLFVVSGQMLCEIKYRGRFPLTGVGFTLGFMIMMSLDVALGQ